MNQLKKIGKDSMTLIGTGIGLGIGTQLISEVGGNTAALSRLSSGMNPIGRLTIASHSIGILSGINDKLKKSLRR